MLADGQHRCCQSVCADPYAGEVAAESIKLFRRYPRWAIVVYGAGLAALGTTAALPALVLGSSDTVLLPARLLGAAIMRVTFLSIGLTVFFPLRFVHHPTAVRVTLVAPEVFRVDGLKPPLLTSLTGRV